VGGPRYMNQRFQDAIALAHYYHGFDLFIMFTCNSQWPEITSALLPSQTPSDRPNAAILALLPGNERTYTSADSYSVESPAQTQPMPAWLGLAWLGWAWLGCSLEP
jgi:hypothetical protein